MANTAKVGAFSNGAERCASAPTRCEILSQGPWLGETDIAGKTLFVFAEQGLGDTIQFFRYLEKFKSLGCDIAFEAQPPLVPLIAGQKRSFRVIGRGNPISKFDVLCPLLSAPLAFKTTLETIPASVPYLTAPPDKAELWRNRLGQKRKPRIGLAWSGSPTSVNDAQRSMPLKFLLPLIGEYGEWYSLQKDVRERDRDALSATPAIINHAETFTDFTDTAALIAELDLIISVDCVISHLAGAMGKPSGSLSHSTRIFFICAIAKITPEVPYRALVPSADLRGIGRP